MRLITYPALFFICIFCTQVNAQNAIATDTMTVEWEQLDGPPGYVSKFVELNGRMFAATKRGLYYSDNYGKSWKFNMALGLKKQVEDISTVSGALFVAAVVEPAVGSRAVLYRSTDNGVSWQELVSGLHIQTKQSVIYTSADSIVIFIYPDGSTTRYIQSHNLGQTWDDLTLHHPYIASLTQQSDTIIAAYSAYIPGKYIPLIVAHGDFDHPFELDYASLPPITSDFFVCYQNSVYSIITPDHTIYQSSDLGANWSTHTLPFSDIITSVHYENGELIIQTAGASWKGSLNFPFNLTPVFSLYGNTNTHSVSHTASGWWVNAASANTYYSADNGLTWEARSYKLISNVHNLRTFCGRLASLDNNGFSFKSAFLSNQQAGEWISTDNLENGKILGEANGVAFMFNPTQRSVDCGETWQEIPFDNLPLQATPDLVTESKDRIYLWGTLGDPIFFSDDNGANWQPLQSPYPYAECKSFIANGDTLIFLTSTSGVNELYKSFNHSASWESAVVPQDIRRVVKLTGNRLLGLADQYYSTNIYLSTDLGTTWQNVFSTPPTYPSFDAGISPERIRYVHDEVILMHGDNGLLASSNAGANWTRIANLPFWNFSDSPNSTDQYVEGGLCYLVVGEYLYAATKSEGIWRTPWAPIRDRLKVTNHEYGYLQGRLYRDLDHTCSFDQAAGDKPLSNRTIVINPGNHLTTTDGTGRYEIALPPGNYTLTGATPAYFNNFCTSATATVIAGQTQQADLPFSSIPGVKDLCLLLTNADAARPGFKTNLRVQFFNAGTADIPATTATILFNNSWLVPISVLPGGQFSGNQCTIQAPALHVGEAVIYTLEFLTVSNTPLGAILTYTANDPLLGDANPANNSVRVNQEVKGSFDPNDKSAMPVQAQAPGQPRLLDFLVRFQNTGTDTAFNVIVTDTLAESLNLFTLNTVESSHPFTFSWHPGRVAQWKFRNILLPDSTTNERASHGYVRFQIETNPDQPPGLIKNDADIFFDFNKPVRTNEVAVQNPKWLVHDTVQVKLCTGESWHGSVWNTSALVIDTVQNAFSDTITLSLVDVYPVWSTQVDTTFAQGSALFGYPVWNDTIIEKVYTSVDGCDSTETWHVSVLASGVSNTEVQQQMLVFPNPSTGQIWLKWRQNTLDSRLNIKLINTSGAVVRTWENVPLSRNFASRLDLGDVANGVYYLDVQNGSYWAREKIVKME